MTRFAADQVVRCPECNRLVLRQHFASISFSSWLFPPLFQAIARGDVACPHCKSAVDAHSLSTITRLDSRWKQGVWAGIPSLDPRVSEDEESLHFRVEEESGQDDAEEDGFWILEDSLDSQYPRKNQWRDRFFNKLRDWAD